MTIWTWDPPEAWVRDLEDIGGAPNDRVPYLKLVWEPGEVIDSGVEAERVSQLVQRWMIYELTPLQRTWRTVRETQQAAIRLAQLSGPPPRSMRYYVDSAETPQHPKRRVLMSNAPCTQREWELYRETGHSPKLFWVIQGSHGGHKRRLTPEESKLLKQHHRPCKLPLPGDLCYAPYDRRVRNQIVAMDRLRATGQHLDWERRSRADFLKERRVERTTFAKQLLAWLDGQIKQQVEETKHMWRPSDLPSAGREATDKEIEFAEADFVHSLVSAGVPDDE